MSVETTAICILLGVFFVLLLSRVSVAIAMGLAAIATYAYLELPLELIVQYTVGGVNSFTFLAVPFFILAGELINQGGIAERLVDLADELVGWMYGGAAMVNIVTSVFFGGISGSAPADLASTGPLELKLMTSQGYSKEFSISLSCATSVEGMLIPPSHNLVIYAVAAGGLSVGSLFAAGLPAGLFLSAVLAVYSYVYSRVHHIGAAHGFRFKKAVKAFFGAAGGLLTIVFIFCGVAFGIMTATESAAVAALWAFICAFFIYREVPLKAYYRIATDAIKMLSTIMILMAIANAFGWIVAYLRIPNLVTEALLSITNNKYIIVLLINILILFLGCIMSISSILLILTPIVAPILIELDYSLVQFGIVMILNLGIGLLTPPVGAALYVASAISDVSVGTLAKRMLPFYGVMFGTLIALAYIPELTQIFGAW